MRKFAVILLGLVLAMPVFVSAAEDNPVTKGQGMEGRQENKPTFSKGELKVIAMLSKQFNVPDQTIMDLRKDGYGYGEISHILVIAQKSGQTVDAIVSLRKSGMGWGEIAKKYNLNLGTINSEVKKLTGEIKKDVPPRAMKNKEEKTERPKKEGKMEKPSKPEKPATPQKPVMPERPSKSEKPH